MGDNMMSIRIKAIRNDADYQEALALLEALILENPSAGTDEASQIDVLSDLIEHYESTNFPIDIPNAIEAIKFRMEQLNLNPADLVPYIGSASRVSEILSGKRGLTVDMISNLSNGLGIPAGALIKKGEQNALTDVNINAKAIKQMQERGYFDEIAGTMQQKVASFFASAIPAPTLLRQSSYRSSPTTDNYALLSWSKKVTDEAAKIAVNVIYKNGIVDAGFMKSIAQLSTYDDGPIRAKDTLIAVGIILIIEPHLEKTRLDGAVILTDKDHPIIGLTLRMDRLDNFWFTLLHELAHLALHYENTKEIDTFFDELDHIKGENLSDIEQEADKLAAEVLVPSDKWQVSAARISPNPLSIASLATDLGVHPVIIAGKFRHDSKNYARLNKMIKEYKVKYLFHGGNNE